MSSTTTSPGRTATGPSISSSATFSAGTKRPLIYIDNWDFKWQGFYTFSEPVPLPSGASVQLSAIYDNSESNPNNPNNPLIPVRWGEGTNDEMCLGFLGMVFDNESLLPFNSSR